MKRQKTLWLVVCLSLMILFCSGCASAPHELSYHELMALEKYDRNDSIYLYPDYITYTFEEWESLQKSTKSSYALIEAECLDARYFVKWDEERQDLSDVRVRYDIRIAFQTRESPFFAARAGDILPVYGPRCEFTVRLFDYDQTDEDAAAQRKAYEKFLCDLGASIDEETGYIALPSGDYEFVPMSDIPLAVIYLDEMIGCHMMCEGELYTMSILGYPGFYRVSWIYPSSEDSILYENDFYGFSQEKAVDAKKIRDIVMTAKEK